MEVLPARFWAKVVKTDGCWLWTGASSSGYGTFNLDGRPDRVHRIAYRALVGPIPDGFHIDHLCGVRLCMKPAHLEAVTQRENSMRRAASVTACPEGHPYDEANTLHTKGGRRCRRCHRDRERARYHARKAAA